MTIKSYIEWAESNNHRFLVAEEREAYNAGVKAATDQFELDKIAIHEYYDKKIRELLGTEAPEINEENNGKLT